MIAFNTIPLDIRTPGSYIEFDTTRAERGSASTPHKVLVIGQKLAAGPIATNVRIFTADQAIAAFGRGSMLARMFFALKAVDPLSETWALPLTDLAGGTAATGTVVYAGTATAAGSIPLYVAGQKITVPVTVGMTAAQAAAAVNTAVGATPDLPVTGAVVTATVTLTARHKGEAGNYIDIRHAYQVGEALPAGLTATITAMSAGAGNPDAGAVFTTIGDAPYTAFIHPYTDAANLTAIETALTARWGAMVELDGMAYSAATGSQGGLSTLGGARNSAFSSIIGYRSSPTPPWEWAAAYGAVVSYQGSLDPARGFEGLALAGIKPPAMPDRWTRSERDSLLRDGIAVAKEDSGGVVIIDRAITTFQTNAQGFDSIVFLDVNTPLTLANLRYTWRARIATKYPRHKLADDGTYIAPGQPIVTPKTLKVEAVAWFIDRQEAGLVEGLEQFKAELVIERDPNDPNRVNSIFPPNLVNQFRVFAGQIQFLL
ncbi:phage tail sheath subtilisin-like domain-containing protein [Caulobacter soli]|uniref:phage tail sheath subtilisin-like domain-containing protein n=1 Tax=Caulobacter soli TaxID=2708539 RepID=UPI0013E9C6DF|nr:phage tail sheath subtilisin-like domain-containing protein [Caulobacter soli]